MEAHNLQKGKHEVYQSILSIHSTCNVFQIANIPLIILQITSFLGLLSTSGEFLQRN